MTEGFETPFAKLFTVANDGRITFDWARIEQHANSDSPMRLWCSALIAAYNSGVAFQSNAKPMQQQRRRKQ